MPFNRTLNDHTQDTNTIITNKNCLTTRYEI